MDITDLLLITLGLICKIAICIFESICTHPFEYIVSTCLIYLCVIVTASLYDINASLFNYANGINNTLQSIDAKTKYPKS